MEAAQKQQATLVPELTDAKEVERRALLDLLQQEFQLPSCLGDIILKFLDSPGLCDECNTVHPFSHKCVRCYNCQHVYFCATCEANFCEECSAFGSILGCCDQLCCKNCMSCEVWECNGCKAWFHHSCMRPKPAKFKWSCRDCRNWKRFCFEHREGDVHCRRCYEGDLSKESSDDEIVEPSDNDDYI